MTKDDTNIRTFVMTNGIEIISEVVYLSNEGDKISLISPYRLSGEYHDFSRWPLSRAKNPFQDEFATYYSITISKKDVSIMLERVDPIYKTAYKERRKSEANALKTAQELTRV